MLTEGKALTACASGSERRRPRAAPNASNPHGSLGPQSCSGLGGIEAVGFPLTD